MSRIPASSPISTDVEDVRHTGEDDFFGEDGEGAGASEPRPGADEREGSDGLDEERDELDALAAASVEGRPRWEDAEARRGSPLA